MKDCGDAIGVEVDTPPFLSDVPRYTLFRIFFQKGIMPSMLKHVSASILALSLLCPAMASAQQQQAVPQNRAAMQLSFAPLGKRTADAVVNTLAGRVAQHPNPFAGAPCFQQLCGQ